MAQLWSLHGVCSSARRAGHMGEVVRRRGNGPEPERVSHRDACVQRRDAEPLQPPLEAWDALGAKRQPPVSGWRAKG
jgi:hypothetical protein